jgi:hypothetical protein
MGMPSSSEIAKAFITVLALVAVAALGLGLVIGVLLF